MGDIVTFPPKGGVPAFEGRGSKLEHPDLLPIFWGSYWPGTPPLTLDDIMRAIRSVVEGPYLDGLKQYGYVGPVTVRKPMLIDGNPWIVFPPGGDQEKAVSEAVDAFIRGMLQNDYRPANIDDNHDLIMMFFLDPSVPIPLKPPSTNVLGANNYIDQPDGLFDDYIRFERVWIATADFNLVRVSRTFCHELVEAITDPFGSGWHQIGAADGAGQIADMCDQPAQVDGADVVAYWSKDAGVCIVPTSGKRWVGLSSAVQGIPHDGPTRQAYVDLGQPLCPAGYFDYVERTFQNEATVSASIVGYESPLVTWTINGHAVPVGFGTIDVDVTWDLPPRSKATSVPFRKPTATLTTWTLSPSSTQLVIRVGPNDGNATLTVECTVVESFDNVNLAGAGSTVRSDSLVVDLTNQKIEWGQEYKDAAKHCSDLKHQAADPGPIPEPKPGDPPDLAQLLVRLLTEKGSNARERLDQAADLVRNRSTELSNTLTLYASRARER